MPSPVSCASLLLGALAFCASGCDEPSSVVVLELEAEASLSSRAQAAKVQVFDTEGERVVDAVFRIEGEPAGPGEISVGALDGARLLLEPRGGDLARRWSAVAELVGAEDQCLGLVRAAGGYTADAETHVPLRFEEGCRSLELACFHGVCGSHCLDRSRCVAEGSTQDAGVGDTGSDADGGTVR